jgi:hypothetical protein
MPTRRPPLRIQPRRLRAVPDATTEPEPGAAPEAVFDWLTGPYVRRSVPARPECPPRGEVT